MLNRDDSFNRSVLFWVMLVIFAGVLLRIAPEEQTLGQGIQSVYVHVGLIWTGMAGLVVAGLLGLLVLVLGKEGHASWMQIIGRVGAVFYGSGVAMSVLASKANWGNVFWQEPRMRTALNMLAAAVIVEVLIGWLPQIRIRGLLAAALVTALGWTTISAPLVLHPSDPIRTSSSTAIRLSFLGFFSLSMWAAAWFVWYRRPGSRDSSA